MAEAEGDLRARIASHFGEGSGALGVAVSGGSDSMALLHLMADWGGARLRCVTVDHRLREASAQEAADVGRQAARLGVPHDILSWDEWDGRGNLPEAARNARYGMMADWARRHGLEGVALGHTADDVAETFLMRLARRAGVDGLAAMRARRPHGDIVLHRPLLSARRADLRGYLAARGVTWAEDPSNDNPRYRRTLARRALETLGPVGIDGAALSDVAAHLAEARATLGHYAAIEVERLARTDRGDLLLDAQGLAALRPDIARRILAAGLAWISGGAPRGPDITRLMEALGAGEGGTLAGCRVLNDGMQVRIAREWAAVRDLTAAPGALWDGRWRIEGPEISGTHVAALGQAGRTLCPEWRGAGLPAASIDASPALWRGPELIAAPLAGHGPDHTAHLCRSLRDLTAGLVSH